MDIEVTQAQTGMLLNRDVLDRHGNVLLRSGVTLTERHIDLIKAHGIARIDAAPASRGVSDTGQHRPAIPAARLFRNLDLQHPLVSELYRLYESRHSQFAQETS